MLHGQLLEQQQNLLDPKTQYIWKVAGTPKLLSKNSNSKIFHQVATYNFSIGKDLARVLGQPEK